MKITSQWIAGALGLPGSRPASEPGLTVPNGEGAESGEAGGALRAVLSVSPQAIIALDAEGLVTLWSPAAEGLLGWTAADVVGRPLPLVVEDASGAVRALAEALPEGGAWTGAVVRTRRKGGGAVMVRVWAAPWNGEARGGYVLAIEGASVQPPPADHEPASNAPNDAATALLGAALHAGDLRAVLEHVVEIAMTVAGVTVGGVWVGRVCVVRGLPEAAAPAFVSAAQSGVKDRSGSVVVSDCVAALAEGAAGVERFLQYGIHAAVITTFASVDGRGGGVVVGSPEPRAWTAEECALIEAAGRAVAEAADRLSRLAQTEERLALLDQVRTVGKSLHRPASTAETARTAGEGALDLSGADRAAVYLCRSDETLACAWSHNLSRAYEEQVVQFANSLARGRVMDGAKPDVLEFSGRGIDITGPVLYPDVQALPPAVRVPRLTQAEGYRALGNWPLVYEGTVLGLLSCYYDEPLAWSVPEQEMMQTFADDAAFALHHARLQDEQLRRTSDLEVLFDLSRRLRAARNPQEIYPILVGRAMDLLHADAGMLTLLNLNPELPEFDCVFATGMAAEVRGASFPVSGSPLGRVVETDAVYQSPNFGGEPLPVWMSGFRGIGPVVMLPVRSEQETIGVLCLGRKRRPDARPFTEAEVGLLGGIAEMGGTAIRRARLFENLEASYLQMVISLARTMDARDAYTSGHSERITEWAAAVAQELGCNAEEMQDIRWGALLHDIGKIGVPDAILRKPGKLTDAEWAIMRKHPEIGAEILAATDRMRGVALLVRHHQEKWDGTGYPDGLAGEAIPIGARIMAVCDAYSAITDNRPYKRARTHEDAIAELHRCKGAAFDPRVVDAFCKVVDVMRERERTGTGWNTGGAHSVTGPRVGAGLRSAHGAAASSRAPLPGKDPRAETGASPVGARPKGTNGVGARGPVLRPTS